MGDVKREARLLGRIINAVDATGFDLIEQSIKPGGNPQIGPEYVITIRIRPKVNQ